MLTTITLILASTNSKTYADNMTNWDKFHEDEMEPIASQYLSQEFYLLHPENTWVGIGERSGLIRYRQENTPMPAKDEHEMQEWIAGESIHLHFRE